MKKLKNGFKKMILINNTVFGETMESVRKHKDIKFITTKKNYLVSELSYHTKRFLTENVLRNKY